MQQDIIDLAIKYWNEKFVGISGIDISEKLNIQHEKVIKILEQLETEGKGTLNENVVFHPLTFALDPETNNFKMVKAEPVTTHVFFPAKGLLKTYFKENISNFTNNGEYTNKLHQSYNPLDLIPFDIKVLGKYLNNKEMYSLNDDVTGGIIRLNSDYTLGMSEEETDKVYFDKIWYGKRKLANGDIAVTAIIKDLAELTKKEQSYWYGFELEKPAFKENDNDFNRFVSRAYYGCWADSKDPIHDIKSEIKEINKFLGFNIFKKTENDYLEYPINNTFKAYADCNSELFKLIGPDNLEFKNIKKIYLDHLGGKTEDLIHSQSKRNLSPMQVLELIIQYSNCDLCKRFKENWNIVKKNRIEGDHKITTPTQSKENYIDIFRNTCEIIKLILIDLKSELEKTVCNY